MYLYVKTVSASVAFVGFLSWNHIHVGALQFQLDLTSLFSMDRIHFSQIFKNQEMVIGLRVRASYEGQLVTRQGLF